jgi:hypothetical protein
MKTNCLQLKPNEVFPAFSTGFSFSDVLMQLEAEQEERKHIQSEVKQLQEKLHRKQESFCQLQEEKEKLYSENR